MRPSASSTAACQARPARGARAADRAQALEAVRLRGAAVRVEEQQQRRARSPRAPIRQPAAKPRFAPVSIDAARRARAARCGGPVARRRCRRSRARRRRQLAGERGGERRRAARPSRGSRRRPRRPSRHSSPRSSSPRASSTRCREQRDVLGEELVLVRSGARSTSEKLQQQHDDEAEADREQRRRAGSGCRGRAESVVSRPFQIASTSSVERGAEPQQRVALHQPLAAHQLDDDQERSARRCRSRAMRCSVSVECPWAIGDRERSSRPGRRASSVGRARSSPTNTASSTLTM